MISDEHFLNFGASEQQRTFLQNIFELGIDFLDGNVRNGKVLQYADNEELKNLFSEPLPKKGLNFGELYQILRDRVAAYSISQSDQRYLAFPDTGNSVATIAADILCAFLNQNLIAVDRSAPSGTFIELQLLLWLRELIGFESKHLIDSLTLQDVGGMWTSGGSMSNHIAILIALHQRFPEIKKTGLTSLKKRPVLILAKGIEHFSFASAALALGLGSEGILWADTNPDFTTNIDSIKEVIESCPSDAEPIMAVCVAGNCRTTSIDDIVQMRRICDNNNIWLHVDACHGGSLLFSSNHSIRLHGIETADSLSIDPHKGLFVTYPSSYVIFRNPAHLASLCRYPEKTTDAACMDLGLITPFFGSRGFQSLKLWLLIKHLGLEGLGQAIDSRQILCHRWAVVLEETRLFAFFNDNDFYRIAFVFCPEPVRELISELLKDEENTNRFRDMICRYTAEFCNELYRSGRVVFDLFTLQDIKNRIGLGSGGSYTVMAIAIGHPFIGEIIEGEITRNILDVGLNLKERMLKEAKEKVFPFQQESSSLKFGGPAGW